MRIFFIVFGLLLIGTSVYNIASGRGVPLARGWHPNAPPSMSWRLIGVSGVLGGCWIVLAAIMGISPLPPFRPVS